MGLTVLLVGAAVLSALSIHREPGTGGPVVVDLSSGSSFVNPLLASTDTDVAVTHLIFPGLLTYAPDGSLADDLASSWSVSEAGRLYLVHLKPGIRWQNGNRLTSRDVVATFRTLASPTFPTHTSAWTNVSIHAAGPEMVRVLLPRPDYTFASELTTGIVPTDYAASATPIGSGEYVLSSAAASALSLGLSPEAAAGSTLITRATFLTESGTLPDLACHSIFQAPPDTAIRVTRLLGLELNARAIPQRQVRVALMSALGASRATALSTLSNPLPSWPAGPSGVSSVRSRVHWGGLLRAAGWRLRGGRWWRHHRMLRVIIAAAKTTSENPFVNAVGRTWEAMHIGVRVARENFPTLVRRVLYRSAFAAAIVDWDFGSPDYNPLYLWGSRSGLNFSHVSDKALDRILNLVGRTASQQQRNVLRSEAGFKLMSDGIAIGLAPEAYACQLSARLRGYQAPSLVTDAGGLLAGMAHWYVSSRIVFRNPF